MPYDYFDPLCAFCSSELGAKDMPIGPEWREYTCHTCRRVWEICRATEDACDMRRLIMFESVGEEGAQKRRALKRHEGRRR